MSRRVLTGVLFLPLLVPASPGCGSGDAPAQASPSVTAESEAGRKARAEDEQLRAERRAQEAKALKRAKLKGLPEEG